jgi:hypothetical protein
MRPLVALLTDFRTQDHYVGAVKGAILSVCPEAALVDVTHDIPAHDIEAGAFALLASYRAFPTHTVFLAVVDPGVGTQRRGLAAHASGYRFVAPDNGLLSHVLRESASAEVRQLTNSSLFRLTISSTFHARDVFGPVAGRLAAGTAFDQVGPVVEDPVLLARGGASQLSATEWKGRVLHVDAFGNMTTDVTRSDFDRILAACDGDPTRMTVIVEGSTIPFAEAYADVAEGEALALLGSSARVEVAVNGGSAARVLGAARGTPVLVRVVGETAP